MKDIGLTENETNKIINFIKIKGTNAEILESLKSIEVENQVFEMGLQEMSTVIHYIKSLTFR